MKDPSLPRKITKAPRRFLVLCVISLLSIQLLTPPGFMPGAVLDGQFIKPCPNSFPKYISDILETLTIITTRKQRSNKAAHSPHNFQIRSLLLRTSGELRARLNPPQN